MKLCKTIRFKLFAALVSLVLLLGIATIWRSGILVTDSISFSKTRWWLAAEGRRHHMADDFLQNHFQSGMTVQALFKLLGEAHLDREHWNYFLSERGGGPSVGTVLELAQFPTFSVRFRAGEVSAVFSESWLGESWLDISDAFSLPEIVQFDQKVWQDGDFDLRRGMALDLEGSGALSGLSHSSILKMLGEPDLRESRTLEYELGWGFIDPYGLVFTVNNQGLVEKGNVFQY